MPTVLPDDVSLPGLNKTRSEEGRALRAYQDAVHVWTVGYGLTNYDKGLPWKVGPGLVITEQEAEWYLYTSIRDHYLPDVKRALNGGTYSHPQGAIDGGTDFHFNCGGILKATWPKLLARGDLAGAERSMMSWNKAGGRVLADLTRRRASDWKMISAGNYGQVAGPVNVEPNAAGHETYHGHGDVLTAYPTQPGHAPSQPGKITAPPAPPVSAAPGVLKKGMSGDDVSALQTKLNSVGANIPVTGTFDDRTEMAVLAFQHAHPSLTADGKVGPATQASLDREINLRGEISKSVKVGLPSIPAAWAALHTFVSAHAGQVELAIAAAIVIGGAAYLGYQYRNDITSVWNRWRGNVVP